MHVHQVWCELVEHNSFVSFQSEDQVAPFYDSQVARHCRGRLCLPTGLQPDCLHGLRTTLRYVLVHPLSDVLVDACVGLNWLLVSFLSHVNKKHHSFIGCSSTVMPAPVSTLRLRRLSCVMCLLTAIQFFRLGVLAPQEPSGYANGRIHKWGPRANAKGFLFMSCKNS